MHPKLAHFFNYQVLSKHFLAGGKLEEGLDQSEPDLRTPDTSQPFYVSQFADSGLSTRTLETLSFALVVETDYLSSPGNTHIMNRKKHKENLDCSKMRRENG